MQNFPAEKLEKLIEEKKWEEVEVVLREWFENQPDDKQNGTGLIDAVTTYVKVKTRFNDAYLKHLDEVIKTTDKIVEMDKKIDAAEKARKIKNKIKDL